MNTPEHCCDGNGNRVRLQSKARDIYKGDESKCIRDHLNNPFAKELFDALGNPGLALVLGIAGHGGAQKILTSAASFAHTKNAVKTAKAIKYIKYGTGVGGLASAAVLWLMFEGVNDDVEQASKECNKRFCPKGFSRIPSIKIEVLPPYHKRRFEDINRNSIPYNGLSF